MYIKGSSVGSCQRGGKGTPHTVVNMYRYLVSRAKAARGKRETPAAQE